MQELKGRNDSSVVTRRRKEEPVNVDRRPVKDLLPLLHLDPCSRAVDVKGLSVCGDFLEKKECFEKTMDPPDLIER